MYGERLLYACMEPWWLCTVNDCYVHGTGLFTASHQEIKLLMLGEAKLPWTCVNVSSYYQQMVS